MNGVLFCATQYIDDQFIAAFCVLVKPSTCGGARCCETSVADWKRSEDSTGMAACPSQSSVVMPLC